MRKYKTFKGVIAFDFDSVIASYYRPFKTMILGKPNIEVIKTMNYFYKKGFYVLIYTGREFESHIFAWLDHYKVRYNGFNTNPCKEFKVNYSYKPYFNVLVDDKAVNVHFKYNKKSSKELIKEINKVFKWSQK